MKYFEKNNSKNNPENNSSNSKNNSSNSKNNSSNPENNSSNPENNSSNPENNFNNSKLKALYLSHSKKMKKLMEKKLLDPYKESFENKEMCKCNARLIRPPAK